MLRQALYREGLRGGEMSVPQPITDFLMREGVRYSTFTHPVAYTAQAESVAASVPGRNWAKTVVCFAGPEPVMVVLPVPHPVPWTHIYDYATWCSSYSSRASIGV